MPINVRATSLTTLAIATLAACGGGSSTIDATGTSAADARAVDATPTAIDARQAADARAASDANHAVDASPDAAIATSDAALATGIVLFSMVTPGTANLGGRAGADAICASGESRAGLTSSQCSNGVHAFLSFSEFDPIFMMPTTLGFSADLAISSPNGTLIASNWAQRRSGTIDASMAAAGIDSQAYWTGSNDLGTDGDDCSGWTSTSDSDLGGLGNPNNTDTEFLSSVFATQCDSTEDILCICY